MKSNKEYTTALIINIFKDMFVSSISLFTAQFTIVTSMNECILYVMICKSHFFKHAKLSIALLHLQRKKYTSHND